MKVIMPRVRTRAIMSTDAVHHAQVIADIVAGSLLAAPLRMAIVKGIIEPVAAFAGRWGYERTDAALGGVLPDLPGSKQDQDQSCRNSCQSREQ